MRGKQLTLGLFILALVGIGVGHALSNAYQFDLCGVSLFCTDLMTHGVAIFYSMQAIAFVFLILLLVPQAFKAWWKFAMWFLPLMFIYFAIYENEGFFSIPEESVYKFLSIAYAVVSIIIIALTARKKA